MRLLTHIFRTLCTTSQCTRRTVALIDARLTTGEKSATRCSVSKRTSIITEATTRMMRRRATTTRGPGAAHSRPCGAARRGGPAPALAPFPVPWRVSLWAASCCWGGCHPPQQRGAVRGGVRRGAGEGAGAGAGPPRGAARSEAACARGPPSSASASTSGLSRPFFLAGCSRLAVGWVSCRTWSVGWRARCGRGVTPH